MGHSINMNWIALFLVVSSFVDDLKTFGKLEDHQNAPVTQEKCVLPQYPEHGSYIVINQTTAGPGDAFDDVSFIEYTSDEYFVLEIVYLVCVRGAWSREIFKRVPRPIESNNHLITKQEANSNRKTQNVSDKCELPTQPEHGRHRIVKQPSAGPGDNGTFLKLYYWCNVGYGLVGNEIVNCSNGVWSDELPTCISGCSLDYKPNVLYLCKKWRSEELLTTCQNYIPNGAEVSPVCDVPYYNSSEDLPPMKCVDGNWNYTPVCLPECGIKFHGRRVRRRSGSHIGGGRRATRSEMPWHVGIYDKTYRPYMQICGGSIISATVVVTAAHCFWSDVEGLAPSSRFAVAAGKLYRPWSASSDAEAQTSDVDRIVIPKRFRGVQTNFQDDIAIVYLSKPFLIKKNVWPVCVDFDFKFDESQLTAGNLGKVAGWGLIDEDGKMSPELQVAELPYVEIDQCITDASPDFRTYITSDKICAGYTNGTALCKGDSGGGLVVAKQEGEYQRYYLRGIASTAPKNDKLCNTRVVPTFTHILAHEHFFKEHLNLTEF